jgi:hypothetical protein
MFRVTVSPPPRAPSSLAAVFAPPPMEEPPPASTWWSRFAAMMHVCGPPSWRYALTGGTRIARAREVAADEAAPPGERAQALTLLRATTHPDTGAVIPAPFRMASHVPVNAVLLTAMLSARTAPAVAATQFLNQSFNAAQFYANRNGTNDVSDAALAASYIGAVASSVGVGVALKRLEGRWAAARGAAAPSVRWLGLSVPFLAAAAAKPLQIGAMRQDEIVRGVAVADEAGVQRGRSRIAGALGLAMTVTVRTVYLVPMLYLPLLQAALVHRVALLRRHPPAAIAAYVALSGASSAFVTPACMALFDQRASVPASWLEGELQSTAGSPHPHSERLYFNKGL